MKGNEARVVFFLHAVEKFKDGSVKKEVTKKRRRKEEAHSIKRSELESKKEEMKKESVLLHTKPYYLAITRSSCEVKLKL